MTNEILELMEERRKAQGTAKWAEIDKKIKRDCKMAKYDWIDQQCAEIEDLMRRNSPKVYEKIKEVTGKKKMNKGNTIKNKNGDIVMEMEERSDAKKTIVTRATCWWFEATVMVRKNCTSSHPNTL